MAQMPTTAVIDDEEGSEAVEGKGEPASGMQRGRVAPRPGDPSAGRPRRRRRRAHAAMVSALDEPCGTERGRQPADQRRPGRSARCRRAAPHVTSRPVPAERATMVAGSGGSRGSRGRRAPRRSPHPRRRRHLGTPRSRGRSRPAATTTRGSGYGLEGLAQGARHVVGDRAGHEQPVAVAGRGLESDAESLGVVGGGEDRRDLDLAPVARTGVHVPELQRSPEPFSRSRHRRTSAVGIPDVCRARPKSPANCPEPHN